MVQKVRRRARHADRHGQGGDADGALPRNTPARQKILDSYLRGAREVPDRDEGMMVSMESPLRRIPNSKGYQATDEIQVPKPKFPSTLATVVLVFEMDDEWRQTLEYVRVNGEEPPKQPKEGEEGIPPSYARMNMQPLVDKLRSADMIVRESFGNEQQHMYCLVSISEKRQKAVAEVMGDGALRLRLKKKDDMGNAIKNGGGWTGFKQHLTHLYERSTEGSMFSSAQQQQIMLFMLNDVDERAMGPQLIQKEACEPGNNPLQQLIVDERIKSYFCLHHQKKRDWLERNWYANWTGKQPIESIREYYGEEVALQCVFIGYLAKMLWVPAAVGLVIFFIQIVLMAGNRDTDNPFEPLFAIYIAVWTIQFSAGWRSMELVHQLEWEIVNFDEPQEDRAEFLQNPRTYKRLNDVSKKEEYFPDPLWRWAAVIFSFVAFMALIFVDAVVVIGLEMLKSMLHRHLDGSAWILMKILGSSMQALAVQVFRLVSIPLFDWLTQQENWKTGAEFNTAMTAKRMCFGFFNSYFALVFVSLLANNVTLFGVDMSCPDHKCMGYAELMIAIIFVQEVVVRVSLKTFIPYQTWRKNEEAELSREKEELIPSRQQYEKERMMGKMPTLELEYASKSLELGYFVLFGASFPMMGLLVLLVTLGDIRINAFNMLKLYQRPVARVVRGIATWQIVLDILAVSSILLQSCFVGFVSTGLTSYFPGTTRLDAIFYAVMMEHSLLLFKVLWDSQSGVPHEVQLAYERKNYERDELLREFDTEEFDKTVAFYTSDDGDLLYSKVQN